MVKKSSIMVLLMALVLVSFASAANITLIDNDNTDITLKQGGSINFKITLNNTNLTESINVSFGSTGNTSGLTISNPDNSTIGNNTSEDFNFQITAENNALVGSRGFNLIITGSDSSNINITINLVVELSDINKIYYDICGVGYSENSNISVDGIDIYSDGDEDEWRAGDNIRIRVNDIENKLDKKDKFDVSLLFYNGLDAKKISEESDDLKYKGLKIDKKDEEDLDFNFVVGNKAKEGRYDIYVKVEGAEAGCYVEKFDRIDVIKEDGDYSIVTSVNGQNTAMCGESIDLDVEVSNIGDEKADRVKVILYNKDLGLNLERELYDLRDGDSDSVLFSFNVPQDVSEKQYRITFSTEFDYNEKQDKYRDESDTRDDYVYTLSVSGGCSDVTKPIVSAKLNSSDKIKIGKEMIVEVSITNNKNKSINTLLSLSDYESWSEFKEMSESGYMNIGAGQTEKIYVTLIPKKSGEQKFSIAAIYDDGNVIKTLTGIKVEDKSDKINGLLSLLKDHVGNLAAYLIIGIIVLIILIFFVLIIKLISGLLMDRVVRYTVIILIGILAIFFIIYLFL